MPVPGSGRAVRGKGSCGERPLRDGKSSRQRDEQALYCTFIRLLVRGFHTPDDPHSGFQARDAEASRDYNRKRTAYTVIVLYTDFGADDPYVGQMKAALLQHGRAAVPIIDLLHRVPDFHIRAGAHLLAALQSRFENRTVFLAVVDPGVGSDRLPIVLEADEKWYVGPDNGLLAVVAARALRVRAWRIVWHPKQLSASFHGRDLFAPIAARIACGDWPESALEPCPHSTSTPMADDLAEIIYVDHYGNAMTGLRVAKLAEGVDLTAGTASLVRARVFSAVPVGQAFWYENSVGLAEIAVHCGSAASALRLSVGSPVTVCGHPGPDA